jgi:hypothetical protein
MCTHSFNCAYSRLFRAKCYLLPVTKSNLYTISSPKSLFTTLPCVSPFSFLWIFKASNGRPLGTVQPADISAWIFLVKAIKTAVLSISRGAERLVYDVHPRGIVTIRQGSIVNGKRLCRCMCLRPDAEHLRRSATLADSPRPRS